MPVSGSVFSIIALCLSVIGAGIFLRMKSRAVLFSLLTAAITGSAFIWLLPEALRIAAGPYVGLPLAALCMAVTSRRPAIDGILAFLVSACYWRLWTIFQIGLTTVCEIDVVFWLYGLFFLLHLPAVLITFPAFSLPSGWQTQLQSNGSQKLRPMHLSGLGVILLLLLEIVSAAIPAEDVISATAKTLLATALFWAMLTIIILLTAYSRKYQQSEAENVYRSDMTTFMNVVRSQRHDYNLHVQTVASLISQQKWDECRSYVNALAHDTSELNAILPVKDPAIAALIANFKITAAQRGITLRVDIQDDMADISTSAYETNKIIGNLLQNALDEMEQSPSQERGCIELGIFKRGEYCLIRVSNQVRDKDAFMRNRKNIFHQGYTTKQGHDGVGLSSIQTLAQQVGGDITVWLENDTAHFVASIPLHYTA